MSNYGDDLRRIVGVDEIKKRLDALEEPDPIESSRGVAWQDGASGDMRSANGAAGSSGATAPQGAVGTGSAAIQKSASQAALDALNGAFNAENGPGPINPNDGMLDLADILDNLADKSLQGGDLVKSSLAGINGFTDCETETDGVVRFNSSTAVMPTGWVDGETPPEDEGWQLGYFWGDGGDWPSPSIGAQARVDSLNATMPPLEYGYEGLAVSAVDGGGIPTQYTYTLTYGGAFFSTVNSIRTACTSQGVDVCPLTNPANYDWQLPYFQLLKDVQTGHYTYSPYDGNVPPKYRQPSSSVYACFDGGSRTATITPGAGDTTLLYETNPGDGAPLPGGIVHIYDGNMQLKGYSDVANLNNYTP